MQLGEWLPRRIVGQATGAMTTVFSSTNAVPAYVRDRLSDDDGEM